METNAPLSAEELEIIERGKDKMLAAYDGSTSALCIHYRRKIAALEAEKGPAVPRVPKAGLLCGDVAVSTDPRYAGWVFVRHADGVNWTTGAKLSDETWSMIRARSQGEGEGKANG